VHAGDMEFKYQTELPPDKQIVTCCPDIQQVNPILSCHWSLPTHQFIVLDILVVSPRYYAF
jgi:hypothetical protein